MPYTILQNVNFGTKKADLTGSSGVGYTLIDKNGQIIHPRTTSGVYQVAPGIYAANVEYPDNFVGQILWDAPQTLDRPPEYAVEQQNYLSNNPKVEDVYNQVLLLSGSIDFIKQIESGRWRIVDNQMIFYRDDNSTPLATFNLYDQYGTPTENEVVERVRVS
jgi:hypothetical protein